MSRPDPGNRPQQRIAFLLTHPIQYISPFLTYLSQNKSMSVVALYQSDCSLFAQAALGSHDRPAWDIPLLDGYEYRFLPAVGSRRHLSYLRPFCYGLGRELRQLQVRAMVVHGYNRPFHWHAIRTAFRLGVKVYVRDDSNLIARERTSSNLALKRVFFRILDRYVSGYLSVGKANRAYYFTHGVAPDKVFDMPWAVDNAFFQSRSESSHLSRHTLRDQLGIEPGAAVVLYVGQLRRSKGVLDLLDAFDRVSAAIQPNPYLVIVGDGELRNEVTVRSKHNPRIVACGFQNQTGLPAYYGLCDVFVLPSHGETWGLVVNEAMNAGKPVIVSDRVGCWMDLVTHEVNGYVFPAHDVNRLAQYLREGLSEPQRLAEMGKRSRAVVQHYSFEADAVGLDVALNSAFS